MGFVLRVGDTYMRINFGDTNGKINLFLDLVTHMG